MYIKGIRSVVALGIIVLAGLSGCFATSDQGKTSSLKPAVAKLDRASDCDDLLSKIQEDAIAKIDIYAQALRFPDSYSYSDTTGLAPKAVSGTGIAVDAGAAMVEPEQTNSGGMGGSTGAAGTSGSAFAGGTAGAGGTSPGAPSSAIGGSGGMAGSGSTNTGGAGGSTSGKETDQGGAAAGTGGSTLDGSSAAGNKGTAPSGYSKTTTQVEGVDEPDIVKTDGTYLYVLHGSDLFIVRAWEPASMKEQSHIAVEGSPSEMFVYADDRQAKAVIFSNVYDQNGALSGTAGAAAKVAPSYGYDCFSMYGCYSGAPFTKITTVSVRPSSQPSVVRELYVEGSYMSARLYNYTDENEVKHNVVRAIVTGGFKAPNLTEANIQYTDPWGARYDQTDIDEQVKAWRDRLVERVRKTELSDWLPVEKESMDGKLQSVQWLCDGFYAPAAGMTEYGVTNIVAFDIADQPGSPLGGASVLGAAAQVYSSEKVLLLAHADWSWQMRATFVAGEQIEGDQTALHRFDLDKMDTKYVASGFVPGQILNQFSLDEYGGDIRVSTTREEWNNFVVMADGAAGSGPFTLVPSSQVRQGPENRVFALRAEGGQLKVIGRTKPLGRVNERIKSTRFLGDLGYVVTFEQKDPLIVLDLSDPANIKVLGQVEIAGFSEYMHPMDETHLLTIGRNTDDFGTDIGLLLQIFDVSDPANPTQAFKYEFTKPGWSAANQEHKAFTYYANKKLLAFPFAGYNVPFESTLEVFRVSTKTPGFEPLGSIDHTDMFLADAGCKSWIDMYGYYDAYNCQRPAPEVRRGVFISGPITGVKEDRDYIYSISYAGIKVHDIADLNNALAVVYLPAIPYSDVYYYGGGTGGIIPPTAGVGGADVRPITGGAGGFASVDGGTISYVCGNGIKESVEECDGADLGGATCASMMGYNFTGTVSCTSGCLLDDSACYPGTGGTGGTAGTAGTAGAAGSAGGPADAGIAGAGGI